MPLTRESVLVKDLKLDLRNFRTVAQTDEKSAVHAIVTISPDRFWALTQSLLDDDFHPTENIIVLKEPDGSMVVKEGNRRIAAMKLLHGLLDASLLPMGDEMAAKIAAVPQDWRDRNEAAPCVVYESPADIAIVDKLVRLAHAKGQPASRDDWTSTARARYDRDVDGKSAPGLDLLEKYLRLGGNITPTQAERWAALYNLTILDEALPHIAKLLGFSSAKDLADIYPKIAKRDAVEEILHQLGLEKITFANIRLKDAFWIHYGIVPAAGTTATGAASGTGAGAAGSANPGTSGSGSAGGTAGGAGGGTTNGTGVAATGGTGSGGSTGTGGASGKSSKPAATATNDPRSVMKSLKTFVPKGQNRAKVVTLLNEAKKLKLADTPLSFCFLLRSMIELSAKAYCLDHPEANLQTAKADGGDRFLLDIIKDVHKHLITDHATGKKNSQMEKALHGAFSEICKPESITSVTSLNQLIHNKSYTVDASHVCTIFSTVFPFLEEMNR